MTSTALRRGIVCAVAASIALATPAFARPTPKERARMAVRYLVSRQSDDGSFPGFSPTGSSADAVVSMVAARRAPRAIVAALDYLESVVDAATLGQKAKIVMAAVAGGRDARNFGGHNLVEEIRTSQQASGQYGLDVTTHALSMLALEAAGTTAPASAAEWLADAQCRDGGWQFDGPPEPGDDEHCFDPHDAGDFTTSDTNTTSYAVQALAAAEASVALSASPFSYFRSARDHVKDGWRYSHERYIWGTRVYTDANSTALVLQAYAARDRVPPRRSTTALNRLQYQLCGELAGAFASTWEMRDGRLRRSPSKAAASAEDETGGSTVVGATVGAIPGVLMKPFPIAHVAVTKAPPRRPACG